MQANCTENVHKRIYLFLMSNVTTIYSVSQKNRTATINIT